jgi:PadR family transcriptional regulator, regulatory protein AphA
MPSPRRGVVRASARVIQFTDKPYIGLIYLHRMELSATAKVILGMLAARPRSGYEIKQLTDNSARFFWAASYGQIYPELKRLEDGGLIAGTDAAQGARQRTVYKLTAKGKRAATEWINSEPQVFELRDEGLLELFFAGSIEPARTAEIARERAERATEIAAQLRALEEEVHGGEHADGPAYSSDPGSEAVLRYGIEMNEWAAEWFERAARDLEREIAGDRHAGGRESATRLASARR